MIGPRQEERDRFLFAAALARVDAHLVLVRRAADDDGLELAPSPFWDEVVRVLGDAAPVIPAAPAHALDGHDERERLQAIAALARQRRAGGPGACDSARRARRRSASSVRWRPGGARPASATREVLGAPRGTGDVLPSPSSRRSRPARRSGSSSVKLHPRDVEQPLDQRVAGSVMHNALRLFFGGVASELRVARLRPEHLPAAFDLLDRCIDSAIAKQSYDDDDVAWEALRRELRRNLRTVVRVEADRLDEFVPRHFEISLPATGVRVGGVPITGRIDRVDEREWVAEALIWDYKSGQVGALGAECAREGPAAAPAVRPRGRRAARARRRGRPLPVGQG